MLSFVLLQLEPLFRYNSREWSGESKHVLFECQPSSYFFTVSCGRIDFVRLRIRVIGTRNKTGSDCVNCGSPSRGRSSTARFGGVTVVLAGDPKQCLPVIPNQQCVFWLLAAADRMTETERAKAQDFANWLLGVGDGLASKTEDFIALPHELLLSATTRNRSG
ncbi:BQ5605_C006g04060 [Microbotryum silenes-dioicae]|uniref:BQ5605_C006g04060 protein n=1 Tax=Microbotryum silenes-dioicae TaxID=796604 RepID=A0A2X0N034_9BASI|nr:BQ5605_C006g04060 [Microbotryum silenes-dioicae]